MLRTLQRLRPFGGRVTSVTTRSTFFVGIEGFPDAINAVFPQTIVQTCVVHLIRNSMDFASWKDRKTIAAELKNIY